MGYCPLGTHGSDGPGEDFHATLAFIVSLGAVASLTAQLFPPFFLSFESPLYAKYIIEELAEYILHVRKVIIPHKSRGEVFFAHENIKKFALKSSILYGPVRNFQYCQPAQNQPKYHILLHKNDSPLDL